MHEIIKQIEREQMKLNIPVFNVGDNVEVRAWITESSKKRLQIFDGIVIGIKNRGFRSTFIVRKITNGEGVERLFRLHSPALESVLVKRSGNVRKSKLYYLRKRVGKSARIKERLKPRF